MSQAGHGEGSQAREGGVDFSGVEDNMARYMFCMVWISPATLKQSDPTTGIVHTHSPTHMQAYYTYILKIGCVRQQCENLRKQL